MAMDSEKAATVRDAVNGLPCVAYDPDISANYGTDGATTVTRHGTEWTHTGECVDTAQYTFRPARLHEAGQIAFSDTAAPRPCYEVILEPLAIPTRPLPTITIPPAVVHEIAKYGCRLRVTAGQRGEWTPGTIRIRDDLAQATDAAADSDRCPECQATRFMLHEGTPVCERCGTQIETSPTTTRPTLEDD